MLNYITLVLISLAQIFLHSEDGLESKIQETRMDSPKGFLVSVNELNEIRNLAKSGIEPHSSNVAIFLSYIDSMMLVSKNWPELSGEILIANRSSGDPVQISSNGGKLAYGTALAWHFTGKEKYASRSRELILDLTDTYGYRNAELEEFHWDLNEPCTSPLSNYLRRQNKLLRKVALHWVVFRIAHNHRVFGAIFLSMEFQEMKFQNCHLLKDLN